MQAPIRPPAPPGSLPLAHPAAAWPRACGGAGGPSHALAVGWPGSLSPGDPVATWSRGERGRGIGEESVPGYMEKAMGEASTSK